MEDSYGVLSRWSRFVDVVNENNITPPIDEPNYSSFSLIVFSDPLFVRYWASRLSLFFVVILYFTWFQSHSALVSCVKIPW